MAEPEVINLVDDDDEKAAPKNQAGSTNKEYVFINLDDSDDDSKAGPSNRRKGSENPRTDGAPEKQPSGRRQKRKAGLAGQAQAAALLQAVLPPAGRVADSESDRGGSGQPGPSNQGRAQENLLGGGVSLVDQAPDGVPSQAVVFTAADDTESEDEHYYDQQQEADNPIPAPEQQPKKTRKNPKKQKKLPDIDMALFGNTWIEDRLSPEDLQNMLGDKQKLIESLALRNWRDDEERHRVVDQVSLLLDGPRASEGDAGGIIGSKDTERGFKSPPVEQRQRLERVPQWGRKAVSTKREYSLSNIEADYSGLSEEDQIFFDNSDYSKIKTGRVDRFTAPAREKASFFKHGRKEGLPPSSAAMGDTYLHRLLLEFQRVVLDTVMPGKPTHEITFEQFDGYVRSLAGGATNKLLTLRHIDLLRLALRELMLHIRDHTWKEYKTLDQRQVVELIEQKQGEDPVDVEVSTLKESMQNINAAFAVAFYQGHVNSSWLTALGYEILRMYLILSGDKYQYMSVPPQVIRMYVVYRSLWSTSFELTVERNTYWLVRANRERMGTKKKA